MINGKMVGEPKPTEAIGQSENRLNFEIDFFCCSLIYWFYFIDEFGSLGFQVVNGGEGKGKGREAIKQLRNRIPVDNRHSSMEIKPSKKSVYLCFLINKVFIL